MNKADQVMETDTTEANDTRLDDMLKRYGEVCLQKTAARILNVAGRTVWVMLEDGRLRRVGHRVDVRSIYAYILNPRKANFDSRVRKKKSQYSISDEEFLAAAKRGRWKPDKT